MPMIVLGTLTSAAWPNVSTVRRYPPERGAGDPARVATIDIFSCDLLDLRQETVPELRRLETKTHKTVVGNPKIVLRRLTARVVDELIRRAAHLRNNLCQIDQPVRLCHLIEDIHAFAPLRRVGDLQRNAAYRIPDVDEGSGLPAPFRARSADNPMPPASATG